MDTAGHITGWQSTDRNSPRYYTLDSLDLFLANSSDVSCTTSESGINIQPFEIKIFSLMIQSVRGKLLAFSRFMASATFPIDRAIEKQHFDFKLKKQIAPELHPNSPQSKNSLPKK